MIFLMSMYIVVVNKVGHFWGLSTRNNKLFIGCLEFVYVIGFQIQQPIFVLVDGLND